MDSTEIVVSWSDIRALQSWFPSGRMMVGVLGSRTFHDPFSPSICSFLGEALWKAGAALVTTNAEGIAEMVTWSYTYGGGKEGKRNAFHLIPTDNKSVGDVVENTPMGWTIAGGATAEEQEALFAMMTPVYILIEGGPRTAMMAHIAMQQGAIIIPIAKTGGAACGLFGAPVFHKPNRVPLKEWLVLRDPYQDAEATTAAIVRIIQVLYRRTSS